MMNPMVNFFQFKLKFHYRALAILASFITLFAIAAGIIFSLIDPVSTEVSRASQLISQYLINPRTHQLQLSFLPAEWQNYITEHLSLKELQSLMNSSSFQEVLRKIQPHFMGS